MRPSTDIYKALGDPTRFRALRMLVLADAELCACEIIDATEKPQYAISKALGVLVDVGLLNERRDGRMMLYTLAHSPLNDALFQTVALAPPTGETAADDARLKARLGLRADSACASC